MSKKEEYIQKLKDPRWQKKRLEILQRDNFMCRICFDDKSTLHVHHKRYLTGKDPWEYSNEFFLTLCETCHEEAPEMMNYATSILLDELKIYMNPQEINLLKMICEQFRWQKIKPNKLIQVMAYFLNNEEEFERIWQERKPELRDYDPREFEGDYNG